MDRLLIVMLAGSLRPSPLQAGLHEHPLCLPLRRGRTLLDAWVETFAESGCPCAVRIVVNQRADAVRLAELAHARSDVDDEMVDVEVVEESSAWRGSGGLLRDMAHSVPGEDPVIVTEAACLPPASILPALRRLGESADAVVGAMYSREPAGVYVFHRAVIERIPPVGYYDMKEQFIPALSGNGNAVHVAVLGERVIRIRDRRSYLDAVRHGVHGVARDGSEARIRCAAARIGGTCVIDEDTEIAAGAVLQDAIVLSGASVGERAVVARSIIGRGAVVGPGERIIDRIVGAASIPAAIVGSNGGSRRGVRPAVVRPAAAPLRGDPPRRTPQRKEKIETTS